MKKVLLVVAFFAQSLLFAQIQKGSILINGSIGTSLSGSTTEDTKYSSTDPNYVAPRKGSDTKSSTFSLNFSPSVHYLISDKLAVGVYGSFSGPTVNKYQSEYQDANDNQYKLWESKYKYYTVGGGLQMKYFSAITEKVYFTLNGRLGYSHNGNKSYYRGDLKNSNNDHVYFSYLGYEYNNKSLSLTVSPSLMVLLNKKWALEIAFSNLFSASTYANESNSYSKSGTFEEQYTRTSTYKNKGSSVSLGLSSMYPSIGFSYIIK